MVSLDRNKNDLPLAKKTSKCIAIFVFIAFIIYFQDNVFRPWESTGFQKNRLRNQDAIYFLSLGDQGTLQDAQVQVAYQMEKVASLVKASFILGLGDNFYENGVDSLEDPQWKTKFENIYNGKYLTQIPWYMCLGDHDHMGKVSVQLDYDQKKNSKSTRWNLPTPYYALRFELSDSTKVHIVVTDSVSLEAAFADGAKRRFTYPNSSFSDEEAGNIQLQWLADELGNSNADWLIVTGHRPVFSGALRDGWPAEDNFKLRMKEVLKKYKVDLYMDGHDHTTQHLKDGNVNYIVNGVGGFDLHPVEYLPETQWASDKFHGFSIIKIKSKEIAFSFVNTQGEVMYTTVIPKTRGI